jgi:hypothetical protein
MLYWRSNTGASSARLYFESFATDFSRQRLDIPVGVSVFPGELYRPLKIGADRTYSKLLYSNEVARGGTCRVRATRPFRRRIAQELRSIALIGQGASLLERQS